jgi:hypothetical protein
MVTFANMRTFKGSIEDCIYENIRFIKNESMNAFVRWAVRHTYLYADTVYEVVKKADPDTIKYLVEECHGTKN